MSAPKNPHEAAPTPTEPTLSRRGLLKGAALATASVIVPGVVIGGMGPVLGEGNAHHEPPHTPESPQPSGGEQDHGTPTPEEHSEGISTLNFATALGVVGAFTKQVVLNAQYDPATGKGRAFGLRSFAEMGVVESARIFALEKFGNEADKHQAAHELADIKISYGLAGGLVALAEATAHIEADEKALFDNVATMFEQEADSANAAPNALESNAQTWEEHYQKTRSRVAELVAENFAVGMTIAPIATTYTSASLINAMNKRVASALAEHSYAKLVNEAKRSGVELSEDVLLDYMSQAAAEANQQMNGPLGYTKKTLLEGGNIQGASMLGDPPNFFYLQRHGAGEWLKASGQGFATMNTLALANTEVWLAATLGLKNAGAEQGTLATSIAKAVQKLGQGAFKSVMQPDYSLLRFNKISENLDTIFKQRDGEFTPEQITAVRKIFTGMPRTAFAYDTEGLVGAFTHTLKNIKSSSVYNEAKRLAEIAHDQARKEEDTTPSINAELFNRFKDDLEHDRPTTLIKSFIKTYGEKELDWRTEKLADALEQLIGGKTDGETSASSLIFDLIGSTATPEQATLDADIEKRLRDAIQNGTKEEVGQILDEHTKNLNFANEDIRQAVVHMWARQIKADAVSGHEHEGGLSHAAKEVLAALATQIPAANAAAVTAQKLLESLDGKLPFERQNELVMTIATGLSGFADNVVAYVFCENVLLKQFERQYGPDVFKENPDLKNQITRASLMSAIVGGALTKIGNGPNFKFEKPVVSFTKEGGWKVAMEELPFKETLANPMAWADSAALIAWNSHLIRSMQPKQPSAAEHAMPNQPTDSSKRVPSYAGAAALL